jgi:hypothetical protein
LSNAAERAALISDASLQKFSSPAEKGRRRGEMD